MFVAYTVIALKKTLKIFDPRTRGFFFALNSSKGLILEKSYFF